jgi:hypothetical protein
MAMYLWFYEWNLLGAFGADEWSAGRHDLARSVSDDQRSAHVVGEGLEIALRVVDDGVELELTVENRGTADWGEHAALIACFNPGPVERRTLEMGHHLKTYMLGADGLERVPDRAMHFNARLRAGLLQLAPDARFAFSERWPTSERDSHAGLLARESRSGGWTSAVAWADWLGVQAHNPWLCMHVATRVGPLARGATRTVRGKLYLFPGDRAEGLRRYRRDFAAH